MTDLEKDKILLLAHSVGKMARELQSIKRLLQEIADTSQPGCDKCIWSVCNYNKVDWDADTPQTEERQRLERYDADAKANADYNAGYEDGLNDAWECARKLVLLKGDGGVPSSDYKEVFGTDESEYIIFKDVPVSEVLSNLKEYEAKQEEIRVGDEVTDFNKIKFVVTEVHEELVTVLILVGIHINYGREI